MAFLLPHEILTENDKALIDELYNQEGSLIKHNKYTIKLKEIKEGIELMNLFIEDENLWIFEKPVDLSEERIEELTNYSEKIDYLLTFKIRSRSITSIALKVGELSHRAIFKNEVTIWEMKDFVETINGFFEIEAEKSSYKLAWGWNHFQEKNIRKDISVQSSRIISRSMMCMMMKF